MSVEYVMVMEVVVDLVVQMMLLIVLNGKITLELMSLLLLFQVRLFYTTVYS